ncbi:MAG: biotin/lipoyl-binding protein [Oscillospiraceae bacterium]|nr:biotin/lipoyl-binding protein [Oscillospiraceae bacterium]
MKKKVKVAAAVLVCLALAAGAALYLTAPLQVESVELVPQTALLTFTEEGVFDYSDQFAVFPLVSGEVLEVAVEEGALIEEGDVIAVLSASDYQRQIEQMQSNISGFQAQIRNLNQQEEAELAALRGQRNSLVGQLASLDAQRVDFDRLEGQILYQSGVVSNNQSAESWARRNVDYIRDEFGRQSPEFYAAQQQLASARAALNASQVQLEALRVGDASLDGQRQSIQAQIDAIDQRLGESHIGGMVGYFQSMIAGTNTSIAQLRDQMGRAEITAPVAGRVVSLPIADANLVGAGNPVAIIGIGAMIEVFIPTREIDGVSVGDTVELIIDNRLGNITSTGRVTMLEDRAEVRLSALGVEERKVRALIQPIGANLIPGHSMDVRFTVLSLPDSLIVPKTAVFRLYGEDHVWLIGEDSRVALRAVTRGVETRDGFVITGGLEFGERVVRDANQPELSEGVRVE